ncbi:MAG: ATP-binding cassette domain-containing protein [Candidatus Caenarcaniphilales bacterium]|nr:ATP-binding cassette domain-containing protein [Candidatus Caenarcaniphilales bacterium]
MPETKQKLLLEAKNISKTYTDHKAVSDFNLNVLGGQIYTILGQNGAGKSSVLRMLAGIFLPDEGSINLQVSKKIGYLPEERGLYQNMKVYDHLEYLIKLKGFRHSSLKARIVEALQVVGLEDWQDKQLKQLSKGMQQKVQFLATILHEPELVILDEPFSGLDPVSLKSICQIIMDLKDKGVGIIISAHQMGILEEICDHYIFLKRGETVWKGDKEELKDHFGRNSYRFQVMSSPQHPFEALIWPANLQSKILSFAELHLTNSDKEQTSTIKKVHDFEITVSESEAVSEIFEFLFSKYKVKKFEHYLPSLNEAFQTLTT